LTLEPRRKLVELVVENTWVQARVAARLQVSRATISKWVRRYRAEGMDGLLDHSSRPQPCGGPDCPAHGATHHRFALLLPVGTAPHRLPLAVAAVDGVESGQPLQLCLCWATLTWRNSVESWMMGSSGPWVGAPGRRIGKRPLPSSTPSFTPPSTATLELSIPRSWRTRSREAATAV